MIKKAIMHRLRETRSNYLVFLILGLFLLSFVSAETNTSVMYGENESGSQVPLQVDNSGRLKINLNLLNVSAGSIASSGNLTIGERITFGLGEIIDNVADGWIRITGALNVTAGNFSLGGKILSNDNGTLKWGGVDIDSNISVLYGVNDSGSPVGLSVDSDRKLNLKITSLKTDIWDSSSGVTTLSTGTDVNITGALYVNGSLVGGGIPTNSVVSFNQASCPTGWVLADGTSGTVNLSNQFVNGEQVMKQYYANSSDGSGSFNITGTGWTTTRGVVIPYKDKDGNWRMRFNIVGDVSSTAALTIYVSGIITKNITDYYQSVDGKQRVSTTAVQRRGQMAPGSDRIYMSSDVASTGFTVSGDVELDSKPTWADADASLIYCVKTAEDSAASNTIWQTLGNIISPVNSSKDFMINNSNLYVNVTSGSVGIGTNSPGDSITGLSGYGKLLHIEDSGSGGAVIQLESQDGRWEIGQNTAGKLFIVNGNATEGIIIDDANGHVGIGTSSPAGKLSVSNPNTAGDDSALYIDNDETEAWGLHIVGDSTYGIALLTNADDKCFDQGATSLCSINADYAELMYSSETDLEDGDVMVIKENPIEGKAEFVKSTKSYDKLVGGVYSETPAMVIGSEGTSIKGWKSENENAFPLALSGRKHIKISDENGVIEAGDLLVTSSEVGKAMRCDMNDYLTKCVGAILGKAMADEKDGRVLALISLQ